MGDLLGDLRCGHQTYLQAEFSLAGVGSSPPRCPSHPWSGKRIPTFPTYQSLNVLSAHEIVRGSRPIVEQVPLFLLVQTCKGRRGPIPCLLRPFEGEHQGRFPTHGLMVVGDRKHGSLDEERRARVYGLAFASPIHQDAANNRLAGFNQPAL